MKKIFSLLLFCLLWNFSYSQKITDKEFTNVIEINSHNIVSDGKHYLINVAISDNITKPVLFIFEEIPLKLLRNVYPEFKEIIIITPNWSYYKNSSFKLPPGIICPEPTASSVVYELKREYGKTKTDSLVFSEGYGFPKMNFAANTPHANVVKIFYREGYGSRCCPADPQWVGAPLPKDFIKNFEIKNKVKIGETYTRRMGKEGEVAYFYTLKNLTDIKKLNFILQRNYSRILLKETAKIGDLPSISTPYYIDIGKMGKFSTE